jgi:hypothetical protein
VKLLCALLLAGVALGGPLTANRAPDRRAKLVRSRGGSSATEKAVEKALTWLARHQTEEGYWDADNFGAAAGLGKSEGKGGGWHGEPVPCPFDREVTALATLAFLGAGHTDGEPYGRNVKRALDWLAAGNGQGTLFAIAYSTQALAEAWDMTGEKSYRDAAQRGVRVMVQCRHPGAGWRYSAGMRMASGVPTTTAVVAALQTAEQAGIEVDPDYQREVLAWLEGLVDPESGKVAYHVGAERLGYTPTTTNAASGLLIRSWLGIDGSDARNTRAIRAVGKRKPRWKIRFKRMKVNGVEREVQIGYLQHYYWWHGTEALARLRVGAWSSWNSALKKALLPKQRKSGPHAGSWDPVGTYGKVGGRVFSTALCALMLESYYRVP